MKSFFESYKNRFYLACFLFLIMLLLAWRFAFQKSLSLYHENQKLNQEIQQASQLTEDIPEMKGYLKTENSFFKKENNVSQSELLDSISLFAQNHNLIITNFRSAIPGQINNIKVEYDPIEVQGSYDNILRLTYYIEEQAQLRTVNHLKFFIHENKRTQEKDLRAQLYLLRPII